MGIVTLTTDFGTADGYVGEMKGVILSGAPEARLVDIAHDLSPGDVESAAWVLWRVWERYPPGSVHVVVVDPGVGGPRRPLAVSTRDRWYVGPDNGIVSRILPPGVPGTSWALEPGRYAPGPVSPTFHGRDAFAPAASLIVRGTAPEELGVELSISELIRLEFPQPQRSRDCVRGRVAHVDRFGNLITDIPAAWVTPSALTEIGGVGISGVRSGYTSVESDRLVALIGSAGTLEIAVRDGSASDRLSARRGEAVSVRPERD
jgi:S-adenosylmethionine hydrolase